MKPYIPYDIIPFNEPIPMLGWAQKDGDVAELSCPPWIYEADIPFREVMFSPAAEVAMEAAFATREKKAAKKSYFATRNLPEVKSLIRQVCSSIILCIVGVTLFCDCCVLRFYSKISVAAIHGVKMTLI